MTLTLVDDETTEEEFPAISQQVRKAIDQNDYSLEAAVAKAELIRIQVKSLVSRVHTLEKRYSGR